MHKKEHGGDLTVLKKRHPHIKDPTDLSTGINPYPYPIPELPSALFSALPDAVLYQDLIEAARSYYRAPDRVALLPVNGAQAAISLLPLYFLKKHGILSAGVFSPTYNEYAHCFKAAGHRVFEISVAEETAERDVILLTNPNNPDGRRYASDAVRALAQGCEISNKILILDESFADTEPAESFVSSLGDYKNTFILRSFGKFFGLAGVRLGFLLGAGTEIAEISDFIGPWPVSGPACHIGAQAFRDSDYVRTVINRLKTEQKERDALLRAAGLEIIGSHPLFTYTRHREAAEIFDRCARNGVYVRQFVERPEYLRFGAFHKAQSERVRRALL